MPQPHVRCVATNLPLRAIHGTTVIFPALSTPLVELDSMIFLVLLEWKIALILKQHAKRESAKKPHHLKNLQEI